MSRKVVNQNGMLLVPVEGNLVAHSHYVAYRSNYVIFYLHNYENITC